MFRNSAAETPVRLSTAKGLLEAATEKMDSIDICVCDQQDRWVDDLGTSLCFSCMGLYLMERYQYQPFGSETEIRLVSLFPGRHEDDLFCEIIHTNLNERPTYEAISYTWGDPALSERVLCRNTGVLAITKNCGAALRDLRLETGRRLLWIDAICINQYDKDERGHQVKLMQRVYARAQQVLIHLASSATDEIAFAMDSLPKLTVEDPVVVQPGLTSLVSLPWFSRVWVLQEVASAKEAWIVIGNRKANWKLLSLGRLVQAGLLAMNNTGSIPAVPRLSDGNDKPFPDLMPLINTGRSCLSSDPRDKIFALLGLLRRPGSFGIQPNYHESVGEIYLKVTKKIIEIANNLDVLSEVARETKWQREAGETKEILEREMENSRMRAQSLGKEIIKAEEHPFADTIGDLSFMP